MNQPISTASRFVPSLLLIAEREFMQLFVSRRGLLTLSCYAIIWFLILYYPISTAVDLANNADFREIVQHLSNSQGINHLLEWPAAELAVYWIAALYVLPFFSVFLAADQTSSDRQRGTLRFVCLRASRESVFFGKFVGQLLIQTVLMLFTLVATVIMAIMSQDITLVALSIGVVIAINLVLYIAPYIAMMSCLSATFDSPRNVLLFTVLIWFCVFVVESLALLMGFDISIISRLLPGNYTSELLQSDGWDTLSIAWLPLLQCLFWLSLGMLQMKRRPL